jgi:hypothetical protein
MKRFVAAIFLAFFGASGVNVAAAADRSASGLRSEGKINITVSVAPTARLRDMPILGTGTAHEDSGCLSVRTRTGLAKIVTSDMVVEPNRNSLRCDNSSALSISYSDLTVDGEQPATIIVAPI